MNIGNIFKCGLIISCSLLIGCSQLLFYPSKKQVDTPTLLSFEPIDAWLTSDDNLRLHGWWLVNAADTELKGTFYYLHGNAQNITMHVQNVLWLTQHGYQVFLLDYRGYGLSEGKTDLYGMLNDIETGFEYLHQHARVKGKPIYWFAQSLGAAMSCYVIANNPAISSELAAVILDSSFTRYSDIAADVAQRNWLTYLFSGAVAASMPADVNPIDYIGNISPTPLLLMHSKDDRVVPFKHAEELFDAAALPKTQLTYYGPHTSVFSLADNQMLLIEYLNRLKGKNSVVKKALNSG